GLTMVTMFLSFVVERAEQAVLDAVDRYADRELAHRFERAPLGREMLQTMEQNSQVLVQTVDQLVQRQTSLWAQALKETDQRRHELEQRLHERLTASLETALERTLETHSRRLVALEQQAVERSAELMDRLAGLATVIRETGQEQQTTLAQVSQEV